MFRFHKALDVITLFHSPKAQPSIRALALLKQISAQASETATEDQASDHTHQNKTQRSEFELNVTEDIPTSDQLRTIFDYVGANKAKELVEGSHDVSDAIKRLQEDRKRFKAPVVSTADVVLESSSDDLVDCGLEQRKSRYEVIVRYSVSWLSHLVVGDNESEILNM
ncbi:MAG: hypothetical protein MMC23_005700 [Stictis urceolatum]|nr:hypothetical protein [Stictis urceolata]